MTRRLATLLVAVSVVSAANASAQESAERQVTIFDRAALFIPETRTYLAGNVGGGVKWYGTRWGIRADYRFLIVRSEEFVPAPNVRLRPPFFGRETRYGHRIFGGVILKLA